MKKQIRVALRKARAGQKPKKLMLRPLPDQYARIRSIASAQCSDCHGSGQRFGTKADFHPWCYCVLRAAFDACLKHYHVTGYLLEEGQGCCPVYRHAGGRGIANFCIPKIEFRADFIALSKRCLTPMRYKIFELYFLRGLDYLTVCPRVNLTRGQLYHEVYAIKQVLGRVYVETKPYALYPIGDYFSLRRPD